MTSDQYEMLMDNQINIPRWVGWVVELIYIEGFSHFIWSYDLVGWGGWLDWSEIQASLALHIFSEQLFELEINKLTLVLNPVFLILLQTPFIWFLYSDYRFVETPFKYSYSN